MATTILLKVIVGNEAAKVLEFNRAMLIDEICRMICKKFNGATSNPEEFGLFSPYLGKWLAGSRTADYYDIQNGATVQLRHKIRPVRIHLPDETVKTIMIDDSNTVCELVTYICQKVGISKPAEYSLQSDLLNSREHRPLASPSKTLRHRQHEMASPHQSPATDEGKWLSPEKSLVEQGVSESDMLILKKKLFYSDQNVDRNDPVQLNLLYNQCKDAVISGSYPCTLEEAVLLAAIQLQVQSGNHDPAKHKPGYLDLKQFCPPEYQKKKKDCEPKIFAEHKKLFGMSELNAKYRYVHQCCSLKTYGISFFTVKEKTEKKGKTVPRLLGISRDSVMRMDVETKEILTVWPLVKIRRWYSSPDSFTLDLGDYSDSYYAVHTKEGDAMSQTISGYIDIILKKRGEADFKSRESLTKSRGGLK